MATKQTSFSPLTRSVDSFSSRTFVSQDFKPGEIPVLDFNNEGIVVTHPERTHSGNLAAAISRKKEGEDVR